MFTKLPLHRIQPFYTVILIIVKIKINLYDVESWTRGQQCIDLIDSVTELQKRHNFSFKC